MHRPHRLARWLAGAAVAGLLAAPLAVVGAPAANAAYATGGEPVWNGFDGRVADGRADLRTIARIGDVVYIGGLVTEWRPETGAPGVPQPWLAAFDASSGAPIRSFTPQVDGPVYALEASADGTTLYVGGAFGTVDGQPLRGFAALDAATGRPRAGLTQRPVDGEVRSLLRRGSMLYVGGDFVRVGSNRRLDLARIDLSTTRLVPDPSWRPEFGGIIHALAVPPDGSRVYAGGQFDKVNGVATSRLVAIDPVTGALDPTFLAGVPSRQPVFDVAATDAAVYVAMAGGANRFTQLDRTGKSQYAACGDGDVQDVQIVGTFVLVGGHFTGAPKKNCTLPPLPNGRLAVYDVSTGLPRPVTSPLPAIGSNVFGVWDVLGTSLNDLWVVGDFWKAGTRNAGGVAHFADPPAYVDTTAPSLPGLPQVSAVTAGGMTVQWAPSSDDRVVAGYAVFVDGARYATALDPAITLKGLDPDRTYQIQVQAFDAVLNRSAMTAEVPGTTLPDAGPPQAPTALQITGGSPTALNLAWDPAVDDGTVRQYEVSMNGAVVGTSTTTTFAQAGLETDREYRFQVVAIDAAGNRSPASAVLVGRSYRQVMPTGTTWKYWDKGALPDFTWRNAAYNDSTWASGPAPLGYGRPYIATTVGYGPDALNKYLTTYARTSFDLADATGITGLSLWLRADDGAAVFINGRLAYNDNIYAALEPDLPALTDRSTNGQEIYREFRVNVTPGMLVAGTNVVAVEIHQSSGTSDDLVLDLAVSAGFPPVDDVTLPAAPGNPRITAITQNTADVAWDPSTDDVRVSGYELLVNGAVAGTTTATSATVTLPTGQSVVAVRAIDWSFNRSAPSDPLVVRTTSTVLLPAGSTWRYWDQGTEPGGWSASGFDDSAWPSGPAELGYGDGDEATVVGFGPEPTKKYITTWFRSAFDVADPAEVRALELALRVDDGAAVYVNGQEVARQNLPSGTLTPSTLALVAINGTAEKAFTTTRLDVPAGLLAAGRNVIAIEVHQVFRTNDDISLDAVVRDGTFWRRDTAAPTTPTDLTVTGVDAGSVSLSWSPSTDDGVVTGYQVLRDGLVVGAPATTSFTVTGLPDGTTSAYQVVALDWAGRTSDPSAAVPGSTTDISAPTAPGTPQATAVRPTEVDLTWPAATDNVGVTAYEVERDGAVVATVTGTTFTDAGLAEQTTYGYRVVALDEAGHRSEPSATTDVTTTESEPPTAPGTPVLTERTATTVALAWAAATDNVGVTGYQVLRDGTVVATVADTAFTDTGLTAATAYEYRVVALDAAGNASTASGSLVTATQLAAGTALVPFASTWSYTDTKVDLGSAWRDPAYVTSDPVWKQGSGPFGYGDGDEATVLNGGGATPSAQLFTYYFRRDLEVADPGQVAGLRLELVRDDGAAVYVNGVEVARTNLPGGALSYTTKALTNIGGADESTPVVFDVPASVLVPGRNVIAVELHNFGQSNIDASFDLRVSAR